MKALSKKCTKLEVFKASILRTKSMGYVEFKKPALAWQGGLTMPEESEEKDGGAANKNLESVKNGDDKKAKE